MRFISQHPRATLAAIVFFMSLAFAPRLLYIGDPASIRVASRNLLNQGTFSVAEYEALAWGEKGQYFFQNPKTLVWYSKYGDMNALLFSLPMLVHRSLQTSFPGYQFSVTPFFNGLNLILSIVAALLLFEITMLFAAKPWLSVAYVLACFYTTFLWTYLRAQASELFQIVFFFAYVLCLLRFIRQAQKSEALNPRIFVWAVIFLLALCLTKVSFALLMPLSFIFLAIFWYQNDLNPHEFRKKITMPLLLCGIVLLYWHQVKFGSPLESGYSQFSRDKMGLYYILESLPGLLFSPQKSIFIYFPLLLVALFYTKRFFLTYKYEYGFILAIFIVFFALLTLLSFWSGDWAYGPRYLVWILPLVGLPFISFLSTLRPKALNLKAQVTFGATLSALCLCFFLQFCVNSFHFFSYLNLKFLTFASYYYNDKDMQNYFNYRPGPLVAKDLMLYRADLRDFPPLALLRDKISADALERLEQATDREVSMLNYYWFHGDPVIDRSGLNQLK